GAGRRNSLHAAPGGERAARDVAGDRARLGDVLPGSVHRLGMAAPAADADDALAPPQPPLSRALLRRPTSRPRPRHPGPRPPPPRRLPRSARPAARRALGRPPLGRPERAPRAADARRTKSGSRRRIAREAGRGRSWLS